jgi:NTE family protein
MAEQYIKQKKYSRIVGMSHIPYDKSVPKEYYKSEGERGLSEHDDRINLSGPNEELQLCLGDGQTSSDRLKNKKILKIPPRRIAFCGGGLRCVAHVGVLKALEKHDMLGCVKEVTGISGGSFFALLFILGYTLEQIERLAIGIDFNILGTIEPEDVLLFPLTFGLNSGEGIEKLITSVLKQKGFSSDITLGELDKKVNIHFKCYATELQTSTIKDLCSRNTPNMKVTTAVRASMSLPIMYSPVKDGESLLVDGGVLHNLPLVFLKDDEIQETLGVFFTIKQAVIPQAVEGVLDYVKYMYEAIIDMRNRPYLKRYREQLILIDTGAFNGLDFSESSTSRANLIEIAFNTTEKFLYGRKQPSRRFSVS